MSEIEDDSGMLDCQHQLIARVVLASWTFESRESVRRINAGYRDGKYHRGELVYYTEWRMERQLPDPRFMETTIWCEDKYGAACIAFGMMQDEAPQDTSVPQEAFALRDDNGA